MRVCCDLFCLLKVFDEVLVLIIYHPLLTPDLLQEWSETMVEHCGVAQDFLFFIDGKPWRAFRPGEGKAATQTMRQLCERNVNLAQKACFNGHYGFHGTKASSVLLANGMTHVH